jgi:sulfur relay (sulfurtransferase) complex TusBCD TusD component (DsrE family)
MKVKKTTVDNKQFIKPLIAKLPNWRYFFEILAKLGLKAEACSNATLLRGCPGAENF